MSVPRQRQLHENGSRIEFSASPADGLEEVIEHKPALRRRQGVVSGKAKAMLVLVGFGCIFLLYVWIRGGEAARLPWEKESMYKPQWYAHMATW